ncbi:hypothetical protein HU200_038273 [Digitaria exilis]|uniref:Uncharacterized protein n=1 Tax=Digitaria exilis TaxID=1010633 RepID=A0A835BKM4_9POAL|nr:hypothetical protein HU200_038273 [Digitaria exilis]
MWRAARRWPPLLRRLSSDTASSKAPAAAGGGAVGERGLRAAGARRAGVAVDPTACPFFSTAPRTRPPPSPCGGAHTLFLTLFMEPVEVSGFHERVVEVSAGNHHSCAITGKRKAGKIVSTPTKVDSLGDFRVKMVALGSEHSILLFTGEVLSWGAAGSGRLGHGHQSSILGFSLTSSEYTPRLIKNLDGIKKKGFGRSNEAFRPVVVEEIPFSEDVDCGGYHTCVVTDSGDLYSWGSNENGCLGLGYSIYCILSYFNL